MARKFLDTDHWMLRPLWVRVLVVALCVGWAAMEFGLLGFVGLPVGSPFWGTMFLGLGVYAAYGFFFEARSTSGEDKPPDAE
ncbi:MAG: hypothetical protein U1E59_17675 [Amaricoccus sp.]